jgi:hypothetical protein
MSRLPPCFLAKEKEDERPEDLSSVVREQNWSQSANHHPGKAPVLRLRMGWAADACASLDI